ncbi:hypothetical protein DFJ74DRAFT_690854 [Hyaloraphidium curvatum]|nr:hypothetical protein DFJ74DRAFT_690854 [Hyaloraphidium curvatum]
MFNTTKIIPLTVDLIAFSAILAGVKQKGGYKIATENIPNETAKYAVDQYLSVGDWVLAQGGNLMARYPGYFKKESS